MEPHHLLREKLTIHKSRNEGSQPETKQESGPALQQPHGSLSDGASIEMPTASASVGIKRSLSGEPRTPTGLQNTQCIPHDGSDIQNDCALPLSESEIEDDSDSDHGHEETTDDEESPESEFAKVHELENRISSDHKLRDLTEHLLKFSYAGARLWIASEQSDNRPSSRKRVRTSTWQWKPTVSEKQSTDDDDDDGDLIVSRTAEYFHLACPFYALDPIQYQDCLLNHHFHSVGDIIDHLGCHHMIPVYCPICYQTFDKVNDRDRHILKRTCKSVGKKVVDGLTDSQWAEILKRKKLELGQSARLNQIWDILFPHCKPPASPYLQNGSGLMVSMVRDYWRIYGQDCILKFFQTEGLAHNEEIDEETRVALAPLTLKGLIQKIYEEQSPKD